MDNQSAITASTIFGDGGNIQLKTKDLQLRHNTLISSTAGNPDNQNKLLEAFFAFTGNNSLLTITPMGTGRGGNINIITGTLADLEDSSISANAYGGQGGNIQINAQGIFQSPDSPITASSKLGINGTVRINTLDVSRNLELAAFSIRPVDYTKLIPPGCSANVGSHASKFVAIGSGGLPSSPSDSARGEKLFGKTGGLFQVKTTALVLLSPAFQITLIPTKSLKLLVG